MSIKRKIISVAAAVAIAGGMAVAVAAPAQAINRMACASHNLNLVSPATTCWGNAGSVSVTLYDVYYYSSGNNEGIIYGGLGNTYFYRWGAASMPSQYVFAITIW
jgi:hypothetical protein